ncbi:MAG: TerB family tellurite resistance protein [Bradymonadaceae bacterium]
MGDTERVMTIAPDKLTEIGRLLVGAAYADGDYHKLEEDQIERVLGEFVHDREMASRIAEEVNQFDLDSFSVGEAVDNLGTLNETDRKLVLNMVGHIVDADFTHDFAESDYVRKVAEALGADPEDYEGLTVELVEE